jgi:hypothetical protein
MEKLRGLGGDRLLVKVIFALKLSARYSRDRGF